MTLSLEDALFPNNKQALAPQPTQKSVATQNCLPNLTPAKIEHEKKLDQFITLLFHDELNMTDACIKMEISRPTGYEWYHEWKQTQEPQKVDQRFWHLMDIVEEDNPEKALDCATRVKIKLTDSTVNVNAKSEVTEHIEGHIDVNTTIQLLKQYVDAYAETNIIEATTVSTNNIKQSLCNSEASP